MTELWMNESRLNTTRSPILTYDSYDTNSFTISTNINSLNGINFTGLYESNYTDLLVEMYEIWTNSISQIKQINYDASNGNIQFILQNGPTSWTNAASSTGSRFSLWNNMNLFTVKSVT